MESCNEQARRGEGVEVVREGRSEEEGKRRGGGTRDGERKIIIWVIIRARVW